MGVEGLLFVTDIVEGELSVDMCCFVGVFEYDRYIMTDHDDGNAFIEHPKQFVDLFLPFDVYAGSGFVENEYLRMCAKRPGDHHPLSLPA